MFVFTKASEEKPSPLSLGENFDDISNCISRVFDPESDERSKREAERAGEKLNALLDQTPSLASNLAEHLISAIEFSVTPRKKWVVLDAPTLNRDDVKKLTRCLFKPLSSKNEQLLLSSIGNSQPLATRFGALCDNHYIRQDLLRAFDKVVNPPTHEIPAAITSRATANGSQHNKKRKKKALKQDKQPLAHPKRPDPDPGPETNPKIREVHVHGTIINTACDDPDNKDRRQVAATKARSPKTPFGAVSTPCVPYDEFVIQALLKAGFSPDDITRYSPDGEDEYKLIVVNGYDAQIAVSNSPRLAPFVIRDREIIATDDPIDVSALRDDPLVWRIERRGEPKEWAQKVLAHIVTDVEELERQNKRNIKWNERKGDLDTSFIETIRATGHVSPKDGMVQHGPLTDETTWKAAYAHMRRKNPTTSPKPPGRSIFEHYAWSLVDQGHELSCSLPEQDISSQPSQDLD